MRHDDHDDEFGSPPDLDGTEGLVDTAKLFALEGRFAEAAQYLESALALAIAAGDTRAISQCWHYLTDVHTEGGNFAEARRSVRALLAVAEVTGDPYYLARVRAMLVELWLASPEDRGWIDPFEQIHLIRQHLAVLERPAPKMTARSEVLLGHAFDVTGDCDAAMTCYARAVALYEAHGMADMAYVCRIHEARCSRLTKNADGAARLYHEVLVREVSPMTEDHVTECLEAAEYLLLRHHLIADVDADKAASTAAEVVERVARIESQHDGRLTAVTGARHLVVQALAGLHATPAGSIEQVNGARACLEESPVSMVADLPWDVPWTHALVCLCSGMIARQAGTHDVASASFAAASAWFMLASEPSLARFAAELMVADASQPEPEPAQGELDLR